MVNNDRLIDLFAAALGIDPSLVSDDLEYNSIKQWDSVAHMQLIAALEDAFEIMLDTDDVINMSSVGKAREILTKYDLDF